VTRIDIDVDAHEVDELVVDLSLAPTRIQVAAPRVLRRLAGPKLAEEMQEDAAGHRGNYMGIPGTEFVTPTPPTSSEMVGPLTVEAGVDKRGSGKLMHILAYGSVNNDPAYDPGAGPRRAMPVIEQWLGDAAEDSVLGDD
jgi:hypothetical protein